jgi:hypothetical protein
MKLDHGLHLAYCTNVHRGETWDETVASLENYALAVRHRVCSGRPYAIGLRLSQRAALELSNPPRLLDFQRWLERNDCYVFTINGFPFGRFHGTRVKEQVYLPDWTSPERLAYTNLLFDLLGELVPQGVAGSVSTLPGSFKEFISSPQQEAQIRANIWRCVEHISRVSQRTGHELHLGFEPEPLGLFETSAETISFFHRMREEHPRDARLDRYLGVNYDACHLAVEFEEPREALGQLQQNGIKISKLHLSSALKVKPTGESLNRLRAFADDIYLHQVIIQRGEASRKVYRDLPDAFAGEMQQRPSEHDEWRIHFHVPLHSPPSGELRTTSDHLLGVLDVLAANPNFCSHLEMETYTWEVLPPELKSRDVVTQLAAEYDWTLERLAERGIKQLA